MEHESVLEELGAPLAVLSLAPLPPGVPPANYDGRLWVPADVLFALKLPAATLAAVAVVGTGPGETSRTPLPLRHLFLQQLGISPPQPAGPVGTAASPGRVERGALSLGDFVVPAELWPAPRLAKGAAAAAPALREGLGRPGPGAQLAVYQLPTAARPEHQQQQQQQQQQPECGTVFLRLCTMQGPFASSPALLAPLSDDGCEEEAAEGASGSARGVSGGQQAAAPASPAMRTGGGTPVALSPAMRGGSRAPMALSPAMRAGSQQPMALSPAVPGSSGTRPGGLGGNRGQLPHTPHTPKPAASTRGASSDRAGKKAAAQARSSGQSSQGGALLALLRDQGAERSRLRDLVESLLLRALCGRHLLRGNFVAAPILGQQALFLVERLGRMAAPVHVASRAQPATGTAAAHWMAAGSTGSAALVTLRSKVHLLAPGQELPAVVGSAEGSSGSHGGGGVECSEAAAEAAAVAVGGGAKGAAAMAASRAAAAGAVGGGMEFGALGGAKGPKQALRELVALPLRAPHLFARYHVEPPRGILLYGPPGTGKTVLARAAAAASGAKLFVVNGPDVVSEYYGESEAGLRGVFAAAKALSPSVIFVDELDAIAPSRGGAAGSAAKSTSSSGGVAGRLVTTLLMEMDDLQGSQVVVIAATNRPDAIDPGLRRPGRFDREVEVGVPTPADRRDVLLKLLAGMRHGLTEEQIEELADAAHGFVPADLGALCNEAALAALRRIQQGRRCKGAAQSGAATDLRVTMADFAAAEVRVRPSAMREVAVEVPKVKWGDVGGLEEVKQRLKETVEWPFKNPEALARLGAQAPKGILLHGPPGCSKTLLARAVASQAKLNFLAVKGPELYSKYVGESEKAIATLFARARAASPSIIFFDELDGLATSREDASESGAGVGERVLSQLLQEMDGLQARQNVIVIAATNRLDCIDPALTRPGRFDRILSIPPPDASTREAILKVHTRCMPLALDVDLHNLAIRSRGFSGADIMALCREAALTALEADIAAKYVGMNDFESAFTRIVPSFC